MNRLHVICVLFFLGVGLSYAQKNTRVDVLFIGDMMQHVTQIDAARVIDDEYDYKPSWRYVKDYISSADIAVGNLETTLGYSGYKGYPRFKAPMAYLDAAVDAGVDVFLVANNHIYDHYGKGVRQTLDVLDSVGVVHTGAWRDTLEYDNRRVLMVEEKGIKFAFITYTYTTNIPSRGPVVVNYIDSVRIKKDIALSRERGADIVVASMHWGVEYDSIPSARQTRYVGMLIREGVDVIMGHHPHVVQPAYEIGDKDGEIRHVVMYSLGNYLSGQRRISTQGGMAVRVAFERDERGRVRIVDSHYMLHWVRHANESVENNEKFTILPLDKVMSRELPLSPAEKARADVFSARINELFETTKVNIKHYNN
ncbi:MAG: CapA family protein [Flavobacteriales bacterium]|nr:CapA family protein [Flavobacteriales bacterium]